VPAQGAVGRDGGGPRREAGPEVGGLVGLDGGWHVVRVDVHASPPQSSPPTTTTPSHNPYPITPPPQSSRSWRIFSIDPITARDLDDALSIAPLPPGADGKARWRVGVHIADVASFVRPGGELDKEACARGTST
jgi:hypothetical protein